MSTKSKGTAFERDLVRAFWSKDWPCIRVAGSGCSRFPSPDVLTGNKLRRLAIECKVTKDIKQYLPKEEVESLKMFSSLFGAEPWIAVKFNHVDWFFINPDDMEDTGNSLAVSIKLAKTKGLSFEQITGNF
jgi:holliday junction resolvase Hjr